MEKDEGFISDTKSIKGLGERLGPPLKEALDKACEMAVDMINGDENREMELRNILNFVNLSVQNALRHEENPKRKEESLLKVRDKIGKAIDMMLDMQINNHNGRHTR